MVAIGGHETILLEICTLVSVSAPDMNISGMGASMKI